MIEVDEIVPDQLADEYLHDPIVADVFNLIRYRNGSREEALIMCVKALVKQKDNYLEQLREYLTFGPKPVIIYKDL